MKILCIGHAAYDITIPVDEFVIENTKSRVTGVIECGGGPVSNAAYVLGKWGIDTTFIGLVGNDLYGNRIKQEFDNIGINTKYMELNDEFRTTAAYIINNRTNGSRTVLAHRYSDLEMKDIDIDFIPDVILIDGQEYELSKKFLTMYPNAISIIDAGRVNDKIIELAKMCNYVVCSREFSEGIANIKMDYNEPKTIVDIYTKMKEVFTNTVIITAEDRGSIFSNNGVVSIMPSIKVKQVDSTGAGDIYHGAFAYCVANNYNLLDAIKISNITGALSVTKIGGRFSVPTKDEVRVYFNEFK